MAAAPFRKPRVIFINRFYRPDEPATAQLLTDLAEQLATLGHEVVVIARRPGGSTPREEKLNGVKILRVTTTRSSSGNLMGKMVDFASFYAGALFKLVRIARRDDILVALTDPPLLGVGVWIGARMRGARFFHWVQDIYPELAIELAGQRWLRMVRPLRNAAWRAADGCVTLGSDMAAVLTGSGVAREKISIQPNWAPAGVVSVARDLPNPLRTEWDLSGKFVVEYSGNFGRVHDLAPVLNVADALRGESDIVFLLMGNGAQRRALEEDVAQRGLTNVFFRPPQPRARLNQALALGDLHLVTLRSGCERWVFPSKLYGIAATGRPVVFLGPRSCEVARVIEAAGFGRAFEASDAPAIAAAIQSLKNERTASDRMARAALAFAANNGGAETAANQWVRLLTPGGELATPPARP